MSLKFVTPLLKAFWKKKLKKSVTSRLTVFKINFLASAVRFMALWWQVGILSQALFHILPAPRALWEHFLGEFNPLCRLIAPKGTLWHVHYHVCALPYWDINVQESRRRRLHLGAAVAGGEGTARRGAAESQRPLKSSLPPYIHGTARCFWGFASLRRCVFELSFTQRSSGSLNECSSKTAPLKTPFIPSLRWGVRN